jgi:hypothetical protein
VPIFLSQSGTYAGCFASPSGGKTLSGKLHKFFQSVYKFHCFKATQKAEKPLENQRKVWKKQLRYGIMEV